jgi:AcrR family transcriptional regulator
MPSRTRARAQVRRRPRQARSRAVVDAIVQATVELAAERGLENVSTDHIAARAGVSVGSVYQYFASKHVAIAEAIGRRAREGHDAMVAQLEVLATMSLEDSIALAVAFLVRWFAGDARTYAELFRHVGPAASRAELRAQLDRVVDATAFLLARHPERLAGRDPALLAYVMSVACTRVVEDALVHRREALEDGALERELVAMCRALVAPERA